ncbi:non-muscle cofilin 1-like [Dunckerocampus dactyliophorus]|uniref:non-muscle cofilin 1-like n=1 Tax=Dunckerocampus dactyliophorus TaxID=161453 RepID=UPI00240553DC|nr:non-muscle cofilin 1-like [Dunckerocampus dactyliophorus]XP_054654903.1 non-muscle cofilin 1-like [Dunckerocampus dactyliophorus]
MASGVKVDDVVKELYETMKLEKNEKERIRLMVFGICDDLIKVKQIFRQKDLNEMKVDAFKLYKDQMMTGCCCYLLYDCHFEKAEQGGQEDLIFTMWAHDDAPLKMKMVYASSKNTLKDIFKGIKHAYEFHDCADCSCEADLAEKLGKTVMSVEGHSCKHT